jgi:hypothetical protein
LRAAQIERGNVITVNSVRWDSNELGQLTHASPPQQFGKSLVAILRLVCGVNNAQTANIGITHIM